MYRYFLIAGTPAIGKSNLSSKLLSLGMAVSDLDLVRDIMASVQSDCDVLRKSFFEITTGEYLKQCEILKPAINGMIGGIVKNKQHVVILGAHMMPGNEDKELTRDWKKVLLTMPNEDLHWQQFCIRAENDARQIMKDPNKLKINFQKTRDYQNFLIDQAKRHGWDIVENGGDVLDCIAKILAL